jgi:uncharacterized phage infection (PIP) family protein YhgE
MRSVRNNTHDLQRQLDELSRLKPQLDHVSRALAEASPGLAQDAEVKTLLKQLNQGTPASAEELRGMLTELFHNLQEMIMSWKDDLKAAIEEDTSVTQGVVDLLAKQADQIQELINNGTDPAEMQKFVDEIRANTGMVAAAVTANTPVPPEPTPVVPQPEVQPTTPAPDTPAPDAPTG